MRKLTRRSFGTMALAGLASPALGQTTAEVNILGYHGIFSDNYVKAVIEPFIRATGIQVNYRPIQLSVQNLGMLRAQKGNPTIDLSIMDAMVARTGNVEGIFAEVSANEVPNIANLYDEAHVNGAFGRAVTFDHSALIYNSENVRPAPTALADMWKPEFRGKIAMYAAPEIAALMNMLLINRQLGADERRTVQPAIDRLRELAPAVQTWQPTPDPYTLVMNGTALIGTGWNARSQYFHTVSQGKLGVTIPAEGSMFQINTISLVNGAPSKAGALRFMDYALSAEAQAAFTDLMYYAPTNKLAQPSAEALTRTATSPEDRAKMKPLDWEFFVRNREAWLQQWRRQILSVR
jgi:putative spermidine/putrescine transport system substrate-binding protein